MRRMRKPYPTDLSDAEWAYLEGHLPTPERDGRPRVHSLREILDAAFYVVRSGCQWRLLPHDFPPWKTVYYYFRSWRLDGTWERMHTSLRKRVRVRLQRDPQPSAAIVDSQSVKTTGVVGRRIHRRRQRRGLGAKGFGMEYRDSAPSAEIGSGGGDEEMGERVDQRGSADRSGEAARRAERSKALLAEEVDRGAYLLLVGTEQEVEQGLRAALCERRSARVCCHDSPHGEATRPCLRAFHTASPHTRVNKGERMRCWKNTGRDEGSVPIMGTTLSVGKREVECE